MKYNVLDILNNIVFPCSRGSYLISERESFEGVHAVLCAKEISSILENQNLELEISNKPIFETHNEGKNIVCDWAMSEKLDYDLETDISVGVADVLVYGNDIGIFEIGTTRPTKMLLLLKYISRERQPMTVHFWPYGIDLAIIFKNWK